MLTKVLILDDDPMLGLLYHGIFETLPDARVDIVNTPACFWSLVGTERFDLIFMDIELGDPHEDGLGILAKMGQVHPALPIIMMSSRDDCETVRRCIELGACIFQPKHSGFVFKLREFVDTITRHNNIFLKSA